MPTKDLFVTKLHVGELTDTSMLTELRDAVRAIARSDEAGQLWSKQFDYRGYCSCASLNELHRRDDVFGRVGEWLTVQAEAFASDCAFALDRSPRLERMWINIIAPAGFQRSHVHVRSILSGVLYIDAPEGSGSVCFEDPRLAMMMAAPMRTDGAPLSLHSFVAEPAKVGGLLMWESWLRHEVLTGTACEDRASLVFDFV